MYILPREGPTNTSIYLYLRPADRVKTVTHKLNAGSAVTLANNTYDDLGRLKKNSRNGVSSLSDSYTYNVRSWLTGISGSQYVENLTYDYNGNISSMQWRLDGITRKYAYGYDPLSRLVSATFSGGRDVERYNTLILMTSMVISLLCSDMVRLPRAILALWACR